MLDVTSKQINIVTERVPTKLATSHSKSIKLTLRGSSEVLYDLMGF